MKMIKLWCNYLKINDFMKDEKFNKFIEFCKKNSINYISQIDETLLRKYSNEDGVGPGRIKKIKNDLEQIFIDLEKQKNYKRIMNSKIGDVIFIIKELKDIKFEEFLSFTKEKIESLGLSKESLERVYSTGAATLPVQEIIRKLNLKLNQGDKELLIDRLENGKTLEEIGNIRGISRERTRQIEIKVKNLIFNIFTTYNLNVALRIDMNFKDEIPLEEMEEIFGDENKYLVSLLKRNEIFSRPYYIDFLDIFLFDKRERFFKIFYSLEFLDVISEEELYLIQDSFKSFKWVGRKEIEKIITKMGYTQHGNFYLLHDGYKDILELYFNKIVEKPLRIDELSISSIIEDINISLNYHLYEDDFQSLDEETISNLARRLEGLLSRIEGIIMTDSRTYIHIDKIEYNLKKLVEIKNKVVTKETKYIDSIALFKSMEDEFKQNGIMTDYMLYSLFKYHFSDDLNLNTNGNSRVLTIGEQEFNRVEELEKFIKNEGKILEKSYIQEKLGYSSISLNNAIDNSKQIIIFDRSCVGLVDFVIITKDEIRSLKELVERNEEEGYISIPEFISKMRLDKRFKRFVRKNRINKYFIASYIRYLLPEYRGGCNILSKR
ncbi:hypothetical protein H3N56_10800 [Cetobacterium sp. 2A]|uniref:sigma factor-like helix-turn-helix DNA-binding protein n=1 Tax=Cetobacterium sp. 2A TaxID=2754723 RepID=UPI00163C52E8|nr:sigma factor-like helix-turn-helix DNA-binding protein [Cetobacterium sp. 2A]MBC2856921.1 hypothetical protein [Cetobacterium sp. 2A]